MPSGTRPATSGRWLSPNSNNAAARHGWSRLRAPGRDRGLGEPDRQAAAPAQAGVVRSPVRDPMALPRNMVTAVSEALERQRVILDGRGHRQAVSLPQAAGGWRSMQQSGGRLLPNDAHSLTDTNHYLKFPIEVFSGALVQISGTSEDS